MKNLSKKRNPAKRGNEMRISSRSPRKRMVAASPLLLERIGELGLLERLKHFAAPPDSRLILGFGDDAAIWDPELHDPLSHNSRPPLILATTDTMVEDVHFRPEWASWEEIGRKLIASNVSDIAAMGGRPTLALISLACPPKMRLRDIESLYSGIKDECRRWGAVLAGGDSVRCPQVVLTLTLLGEKERDCAPARRGDLVPGQRIFVTGWPGESGAGLALLQTEGRPPLQKTQTDDNWWISHLIARHHTPTPRLAAGQALARSFPDLAMIDISDGLDNELHLLAAASGARIQINLASLPISPALVRFGEARDEKSLAPRVLFGGEDYELLFAVRASFEEVSDVVGRVDSTLAIHEIGCVASRRRGGQVVYVDDRGRPLDPPRGMTFQHFESLKTGEKKLPGLHPQPKPKRALK